MLTDLLLSFLLSTFRTLMMLVPNLNIDVQPLITMLDGARTLFSYVGYVVPVSGLMPPFILWIAVKYFHFIWKIIQRVWDALPLT